MVSLELLLLGAGVGLLGLAAGAFAWARRRHAAAPGALGERPAKGHRPETSRLGQARAAGFPAKQTLLRDVHDSEIEAQIRTGALVDAITLYREKTGVGLQEAKDAVEAWRDRLRAS